jgi:hypothetical protein
MKQLYAILASLRLRMGTQLENKKHIVSLISHGIKCFFGACFLVTATFLTAAPVDDKASRL